MKVCYIYREKERKAHSIELLFGKISKKVNETGIEVENWYKPLSNLKAIISLRKLKADVYHITGDCYFLSLFLPWNKTIMTIHDIGMYKNHPKTIRRIIFVLVSFILPMKFLRYSTAISELTKQDLVSILGINSSKIKVIPNPLVLPLKYKPKTFNNSCPTILQIGTGQHKNLIGLIEAAKGLNCFLEIVGKPDKELIERLNLYEIDYHISYNLLDQDILTKYYDCDIVYFASLSEGFGLPILEAQTIGRPIITSDMEPMRSIASKGCLLVDPMNYQQIRMALLTIINNIPKRKEIVNEGLKNIQQFDVNDIVKSYVDLYINLINEKHSTNYKSSDAV